MGNWTDERADRASTGAAPDGRRCRPFVQSLFKETLSFLKRSERAKGKY